MEYEFDDILYTVVGGVATITINRPQSYNSVTQHSIEELTAAFRDAAEDDEVDPRAETSEAASARITGKYSGLAPAMTALAAIDWMVGTI